MSKKEKVVRGVGFDEAVESLVGGAKMRREAWKGSMHLRMEEPDKQNIELVVDGKGKPYRASQLDMRGKDWVVYASPEEILAAKEKADRHAKMVEDTKKLNAENRGRK